MVTIKLNDEPFWICGSLIFSGHHDPTWLISKDKAQEIIKIWDLLQASPKHLSIPKILGYKGSFLLSSDKSKWNSFRGIVTLSKENIIIESRIDTERNFEKTLLDTAPPEAIPKVMLLEEFK